MCLLYLTCVFRCATMKYKNRRINQRPQERGEIVVCASKTVCIAYSGSKVDSGEMDINALAPALLSFSDLIAESNRILNPGGSKVAVYVRSNFQQGSFEINLDVVRSLSDRVIQLFQGAETLNVGELLNNIGLGATITGVSLLSLIRWIKGRKIDKITTIDKNYVKIQIDKEEREISLGIFKLLKSRKVHQSVRGVLAPLKTDGIEAFEVRNKEPQQTVQKITKEEVNLYDINIEAETESLTTTRQSFVHIVSLGFEEGLKWRFDDGEIKFYAEIRDKDFIESVQSGEFAFRKGDILAVDITTVQRTNGEIIKTEFFVDKMLRIIPKGEQLNLSLDNDE